MWKAIFSDSTLEEYTANGEVLLFKKVMDKQNDLKKLEIHQDNGDVFGIDLTTGLFSVMKEDHTIEFYGLPQDQYSQNVLSNIRPIYFVRESVDFAFNELKPLQGSTVFTALGFQASDKDNRNRQVFLAIYPNSIFDIRLTV